MKYRPSFYKHGCKDEYVAQVMECGLWYELHESERHNTRVMYVGWDDSGNTLWEIGIEYFPEGEEDWVFHAQPVTAFSRKRLKL